jgi:hypothetical protein
VSGKADVAYSVTLVIGADGVFAVEVVWPNEGVWSAEYEGADFGEALLVALDRAELTCLDIAVKFRGCGRCEG